MKESRTYEAGEPITQQPICNKCKHHIDGDLCQAFPEGIPMEILLGENDHSKPLKDQENKLVFEPLEEES